MIFLKILLVCVLVALMLAAALCIIYKVFQKSILKDAAREVGTIVGQLPTRIPFLGRNHIMLTRKGKPYYAFSQIMLKKNLFKIGAKVPITMQAMRVHGEKMQVAYILQKARSPIRR